MTAFAISNPLILFPNRYVIGQQKIAIIIRDRLIPSIFHGCGSSISNRGSKRSNRCRSFSGSGRQSSGVIKHLSGIKFFICVCNAKISAFVGNHLFQLRAFACYMMDSAGGVRAHTVVAHASESVFHFLCSIVTQTASRDLREFSLPSLRKLYLWLCEAMDSIPFENHNSK